MTKYLINRLIRGLLSVAFVVAIVMILIYSCLDKTLIFQSDPVFSKQKSNAKEVYQMERWEQYGYLDYVPYADWLKGLLSSGEIDQETYDAVIKFGDTAEKDSEQVAEYVQKFTEEMERKGYKVERLSGKRMSKKNK